MLLLDVVVVLSIINPTSIVSFRKLEKNKELILSFDLPMI